MNILKSENKICPCCMEEHKVDMVEVQEDNIFKGDKVHYNAIYEYCYKADEFFETDDMITLNDISMKNAYRVKNELLTSDDIMSIRNKYDMSQRDLANVLGWGEKTITRYEGHQVQDMAHDFVLKKIDGDPECFLDLLEIGKDRISNESYNRYKLAIFKEYEKMQDIYLRKSIKVRYVKYQDNGFMCGNTSLNFDKIIETISYYANSPKVNNLYKVKLMKLLWYADFLSFKMYGNSITGLIYCSMPMGAVPIAHNLIIDLEGIDYEEVEFDSGSGYRFIANDCSEYRAITKVDIGVLDKVINEFGEISTDEIVERMHREKAYIETKQGEIISYEYARELSI